MADAISKSGKRAGPRTRIGSATRPVFIGDLVLVERDDKATVLGEVTGGYRLGRRWFIELRTPPGVDGGRFIPRSIELRHVVRAYARRWRRR